MDFLQDHVYYIGAFGLILTGILIVLLKHNLIKLIIGLSILETGINLFIVSVGYVGGGTAPIFTGHGDGDVLMVDPVPQALVLTSIVIGIAVLALALGMAVKLFRHFGTLDMRRIKELKW